MSGGKREYKAWRIDLPLSVLAFCIWLFFLVGLTFLFWLRPKGFFSQNQSERAVAEVDFFSFMACLLGILMFVSFFLLGVWLAVAELKGVL